MPSGGLRVTVGAENDAGKEGDSFCGCKCKGLDGLWGGGEEARRSEERCIEADAQDGDVDSLGLNSTERCAEDDASGE